MGSWVHDEAWALMAQFDVQLILCDAAQTDPSGKVHMLGAGWSRTGTPTGPQAVVVLMKIPWDQANVPIRLALTLCDEDGHPVEVETPQGRQQIRGQGTVEAGRPPGLAPGSPLDASFALNVPPLPLPPGRYQWRLEFANELRSASFAVVEQVPKR